MAPYRDPNDIRTYDPFDRAATWLIESDVAEDALKEAILGACGDVDPLESPDIKGVARPATSSRASPDGSARNSKSASSGSMPPTFGVWRRNTWRTAGTSR